MSTKAPAEKGINQTATKHTTLTLNRKQTSPRLRTPASLSSFSWLLLLQILRLVFVLLYLVFPFFSSSFYAVFSFSFLFGIFFSLFFFRRFYVSLTVARILSFFYSFLFFIFLDFLFLVFTSISFTCFPLPLPFPNFYPCPFSSSHLPPSLYLPLLLSLPLILLLFLLYAPPPSSFLPPPTPARTPSNRSKHGALLSGVRGTRPP